MKDNFSSQAHNYAQFRPKYPQALYDFLLKNINQLNTVWDCATGNGQVAFELAKTFKQVYATDISAQQLSNAPQANNITYKVERAERTDFENESFDLITVAQAIHWFNFEEFFTEVKRVLKPDGLFAAIGYGIMHISPEVDKVVHYLYEDILGKYWDEERRHIEDNYLNIPFPFTAIESPALEILTKWNFEQLVGYLETWSSLQHYIKANGENPMALVYEDLKKAWGNNEQMAVHFPLLLKVGRKS
ncbi:methyltransferase domain-containing protein [Pedobacter sp. LMG 31464]|uniref:Methyltransferase domain-containing protein n=1 Tax=Pedobacter planticolens TaxID=2679964 RepID=A0A923E2X8_9SPHI|nr:class I SAM-dependent methyltransferase [Pedobacter planticolens]MBB2146482.1 methyltransferase domain-containing protein [Pedobacter planticolens]